MLWRKGSSENSNGDSNKFGQMAKTTASSGRLKSIYISGYKKFMNPVRVGLGRVNFMVGPNNAGKSSFLHLFEVFQSFNRQKNQAVLDVVASEEMASIDPKKALDQFFSRHIAPDAEGRECILELVTEGSEKYRIELEKANELAKVRLLAKRNAKSHVAWIPHMVEGKSGVWQHSTTGDHQLIGDVELQRDLTAIYQRFDDFMGRLIDQLEGIPFVNQLRRLRAEEYFEHIDFRGTEAHHLLGIGSINEEESHFAITLDGRMRLCGFAVPSSWAEDWAELIEEETHHCLSDAQLRSTDVYAEGESEGELTSYLMRVLLGEDWGVGLEQKLKVLAELAESLRSQNFPSFVMSSDSRAEVQGESRQHLRFGQSVERFVSGRVENKQNSFLNDLQQHLSRARKDFDENDAIVFEGLEPPDDSLLYKEELHVFISGNFQVHIDRTELEKAVFNLLPEFERQAFDECREMIHRIWSTRDSKWHEDAASSVDEDSPAAKNLNHFAEFKQGIDSLNAWVRESGLLELNALEQLQVHRITPSDVIQSSVQNVFDEAQLPELRAVLRCFYQGQRSAVEESSERDRKFKEEVRAWVNGSLSYMGIASGLAFRALKGSDHVELWLDEDMPEKWREEEELQNHVKRKYRPSVQDYDVSKQLGNTGRGVRQMVTVLLGLLGAVRMKEDNGLGEHVPLVVLLEEPASYLHPNVAHRLTDVVLAIARRFNLTVFIESHNEYMFRQLQTMRLNGENVEDVTLHYLGRGEENIERIHIEPDGILNPAMPEGFLDQAQRMRMEQIAIRRSKASGKQ